MNWLCFSVTPDFSNTVGLLSTSNYRNDYPVNSIMNVFSVEFSGKVKMVDLIAALNERNLRCLHVDHWLIKSSNLYLKNPPALISHVGHTITLI